MNHVVIFQPRGDKLIGAEEYVVQNNSQPAVAFFRTEGNFDFLIPDAATLQQVATSTFGMDVPQASIEKGKGRFAIAYPFRPGQTIFGFPTNFRIPIKNHREIAHRISRHEASGSRPRRRNSHRGRFDCRGPGAGHARFFA